ncbi:MAG: ZIP family metal transporter [Gammaproteobacteria bacterium]|nr:ZIP family metal transporter [Gammaproteobacteria bacterium]
MFESTFFFAFVLSLAIAVVSILGGIVPNLIKLTHTGTQIFMSCVAGFLIGVSFLHIIPHGLEHLQEFYPNNAVHLCVSWIVIGIAVMYCVMRFSNFHQHENDSNLAPSATSSKLTWIGVLIGMALHTMVEGFALGTSIVSDRSSLVMSSSLSLAIFFAILIHKPLDALTVVGVMKVSGLSTKRRWVVNGVFAAICPIMTFLTMFVLYQFGEVVEHAIGVILSAVAGALLCVAMSDLLPEAQYHRHDIGKILVAFLFGLLIAFLLTFIE